MADKPVTREEKYLAYLTGDYTGELPKPITRKEKYLYELCLKGIGGEISPEEIKNAVNEYLEKNPVKPGATTEQAQQIEQNKTDVASLKEETGSLKEDLGDLLHHPKEYWTLGDITVPITGEWSNKQVKCEVDLSGMVGNTLKVSVGGVSDNIDTHKCFIFLLDENESDIAKTHVKENTFINGVISTSGGYTSFDISTIKNSVKYIKVQAQAYSGTKPTISGTVTYFNISAKDDSDKSAFIAKINEINLSDKLKDKLRISNNKGCVIKKYW